MKTSNVLFALIKSLTKSEKRYFKVYTSKGQKAQGKNNYIKLFDVIDKQKFYDEDAIIAKFSDTVFIKHISSEKNYLYNLILKTLHLYHSKADSDIRSEEILHYSEILYNKGLANQSVKMVAKLRKTALDNEMLTQTLKISRHCIVLSSQFSDNSKILETDLFQALADSKLSLQKLVNLQEYQELYAKFILLIRKEGEYLRSDEDRAKFSQIINHPLMNDESNALTNDARSLFRFIKHSYFFISGELESAYSYYKKLTKTIALPERNKELSNFCEICLRMKKFNEVAEILVQIKNTPSVTFLDEGKKFYRYYNHLVALYTQTGYFSEAAALTNIIENGIKDYKKTIHKSRQFSIIYYIAYAYFGMGDYKNASKWITRILNDTSADLRRDILCFARILQLIILIETKNKLFIDPLVKAAHYYFSTREKLHSFEKTVLTFFKKIYLTTDTNNEIALYKQLYSELNNKKDQEIFFYFDIFSWLESKINHENFMDVVKSKNQFSI
jgi:tetratricopeptide (TPR) repeat protein